MTAFTFGHEKPELGVTGSVLPQATQRHASTATRWTAARPDMTLRDMDTITLQCDTPASLPRRATDGAFGYDLATVADETIGPRETRILGTGLRLARDLPRSAEQGLAMLILPRSSLSLKHGLILPNSPGLIDADYAGPIGLLVHNLRDEPVALAAGTRIAQAVFVLVQFPTLAEGEADPSRRRGGFGSTGTGT